MFSESSIFFGLIFFTSKLNPDDVIDVLSFSAPIATERFAYRQFKDMLNRTHFKRIDQATTTLTQNLNYYDFNHL